MSRTLTVAAIQHTVKSSPNDTLDFLAQQTAKAKANGADLIVFQELHNTAYFCQVEDASLFDLAEPIPGPSTERLSAIARANACVIVASLFEKRAPGLHHNTSVVFDSDGSIAGTFRKMHIPDDPGFHEKFYFVPGDLGFRVFQTKFAKIGVLICWDQWFPEAARLTALAGADILFYPTAIGWKTDKEGEAKSYHEAWETVQRGHAIANGVYVASTNRVGREGGFKYWGGSFVADPFGGVRYRAGSSEEIVIADCDLSKIEQTRREWPFLRDRRIDAYQSITSRVINKKS